MFGWLAKQPGTNDGRRMAEGNLATEDQPQAPRNGGGAAGGPFASLMVFMMLVCLQIFTFPLFLLALRYHLDSSSRVLLNLPMAAWLLLPLGTIHGLHVGMADQGGPGGSVVRELGMLANAIYLLVTVLVWSVILSEGIFV